MAIFQDTYANSDYLSSLLGCQVSGGYLIGSGDGSNTVANWTGVSTNLATNFSASAITGMAYTEEKGGGSIARLQFSSDGSEIKAVDGSDLDIGSYFFDGSNDQVEVDASTSIGTANMAASGFSVSLWVKLSSLGDYERFFDKGPDIFYFAVGTSSGGVAKLWMEHDTDGGTDVQVKSEEFVVPQDEWVHIAMTWDAVVSTLPKMWVNGIKINLEWHAVSGGTITTDANKDLIIGGRSSDNVRQLDGNMSDMIIWLSELTETQITDLYLYGKVPSGAEARWMLNGNLNDSSGNGNNGTCTNCPVSTPTDKPNVGYALVGAQTQRFDGINDCVYVDHSSGFVESDQTFSVWIKPSDLSISRQVIVGAYVHNRDYKGKTIPADEDFYGLGIGIHTSRIFFAVRNNNTNYWYKATTSTTLINEGEWAHVAGVYPGDGSDPLIYVNGVEIPAGALTPIAIAGDALNGFTWPEVDSPVEPGGITPAGFQPLLIGRGNAWTNNQGAIHYFAGEIASLAYFSEAKSAAVIRSIYEKGIPDPFDGVSLNGFWALQGDFVDTSIVGTNNGINDGSVEVMDGFRPVGEIAQKEIDISALSLTSSYYYNAVSTNLLFGASRFGARLDEISVLYTAAGGGGGGHNTNLIVGGDSLVSNTAFSTVSGNAVIIDSRDKFGVKILAMNTAFDCALRKDTSGGDIITYVPAGNTRLRASIPVADGTDVYLDGASNTTLTYSWTHSPTV